MARRLTRLAVTTLVAYAVFTAGARPRAPGPPTPAPKADGPVQGYQGGYDPIDKSKAPAAPEGGKADTGNADEGRRGHAVAGSTTARSTDGG